MTKSDSTFKDQLRAKGLRRLTARFALFIGAIGSFGFMLWAIYHNDPASWLMLYSLWVMSPFFALFFTKFAIQSKLVLSNKMLYNLMIFISVISLIIYLINAISP
ncbi:MAG: hypothetical protein HKN54_09465, partial [Flavobacteriaceae bacterium]|nr:hypothetical protein [Flavobacteriaceae bacterium]